MFICTICGCPIGGEGDLVTFHQEGGESLVCDDCAYHEDDCTTCGGSGGGEPPFECHMCNGRGRFKKKQSWKDLEY